RDAVRAAGDRVAGDLAPPRVPGPHAVVALVEAVADEAVALRERRLDPVRDRAREVVAAHVVVVAAALPRPVHRLVPGIEEEAVARVRRVVLDERVPRALLEHEDPGRVLSARVHAVAVTPHAEVAAVPGDP